MLINKKLISYAKGVKPYIALAVATKVVVLVTNIFFAFSIGGALQSYFEGGWQAVNVELLLGATGFTIVMRAVMNPLTLIFSHRCSSIVRSRLREAVYEKMVKLETQYHRTTGTSHVVSAVVDGVESLESYFGSYIPQFYYAIMVPFILFVSLVKLDWRPAGILLIISPLILLCMMLIMDMAGKMNRKHFGHYQSLGSFFLESLQGLPTLKLFGQEEERFDEIKERTESFRKTTMKILGMQLNSIILIDFITYGGAAAGIVVTALSLGKGYLSFGESFTFLLLASEFFLPLRTLVSFFHIAMGGVSASEKIFHLLETSEERVHRKEKPYKGKGNNTSILLKNVSFSYYRGSPILQDINMEIKQGETVALVGKSGCGKSTLANMLVGFMDPIQGNISYGEQDSVDISLESLRRKVCLVPQNTYIFTGTIEENLRMANPYAKDEDMIRVCKKVGLMDLMKGSGRGLALQVGEAGSQLSGGQRQKLGIARALLRNSDVFIFDEATSNVDKESEEEIWQAIWKETQSKTTIIISHRLSTIIHANRIYVVDKGCIVEWGNHNHLMANGGLYYQLALEQGELRRKEEVS
ncbi:ATP-binding cassette domain-containing protein [Alkalibaculum sp. M08DMB]|uniref:ATP-binding cassette domain-containing protein n=1 Tax=Alkalibaculum sporogenes TaxID=2655001 RepID=A0A6A7K465_9FIRM|nr:ABC transporter ATP-binding protein/permease [Alkalibaculum sporogenes]MPW24266.1 ATP-binding cassette domain-containing protein [Alkalibaculum sporogenes]